VRSRNACDLELIYTLLEIVSEKEQQNQEISLISLFTEYRNRSGTKTTYYIVKKHVEIAVEKRLLEVRGTKPLFLALTEKGRNYMTQFRKLMELLD